MSQSVIDLANLKVKPSGDESGNNKPPASGGNQNGGAAGEAKGRSLSSETAKDKAQKPVLDIGARMRQLADAMMHTLGIAKTSEAGQNITLSVDVGVKGLANFDPQKVVESAVKNIAGLHESVLASVREAASNIATLAEHKHISNRDSAQLPPQALAGASAAKELEGRNTSIGNFT